MDRKADLHIHTTASDGRMTPQEVIASAIDAGLHAIAITDHDTLTGYLEVSQTAQARIAILPGIEFSTDLPQNEVHILGYYLDPTNDELQEILTRIISDRIDRTRKIIAKLDELGYNVSFDRVKEIAGRAQAIGRPHIAAALIEKKYFVNVSQVFNSLLAKNGPAYISHFKLSPQDAIALIHKAGGLAILAHPGLVDDNSLVQDMIRLGVDGIEAIHPAHSEQQVQTYTEWADKEGLLVTGGSDFHHIPGRFPEQLGEFCIPYCLVEKLQQRKSAAYST